MVDQKFYDMVNFIMIIMVIVALGMFIFIKWVDWKYKVQFLSGPCELCAELNQNQSKCIKDCFMVRKYLTNTSYNDFNITQSLDDLRNKMKEEIG